MVLSVPAAVIVAAAIETSRFGALFYVSIAILSLAVVFEDLWVLAGTILLCAVIRSLIWFALTGSKFAVVMLAIAAPSLWLLLKKQPQ